MTLITDGANCDLLLTLVAQHTPQALPVILERDDHYPSFEHLLVQLDTARSALARRRQLAAANRRCA